MIIIASGSGLTDASLVDGLLIGPRSCQPLVVWTLVLLIFYQEQVKEDEGLSEDGSAWSPIVAVTGTSLKA